MPVLTIRWSPWLFVLTAVLPAQHQLTAKSFLPDDYRNVACWDLAAMRAKGIWDELEVSVLKLVFAPMEKEMGFPLRALDRATMVAMGGRNAGMAARSPKTHIFEGNGPLGVPPWTQHWEALTIGEHTARQRGDGDVFVSLRPEMFVYGSEALVRPVLEGKPHHGVPSPDVLSLLSGRDDSLAWFVLDTADAELQQEVLGKLFPDTQWPAEQAPCFLCLRLLAHGDADDPHLLLELVLRHPSEGPGLQLSQQAVTAAIARCAAMPQLRIVKPVLARAVLKQHRMDLVCTADLGRVRDAIGHVAALALLLFRVESTETVQAVQVAPAPPPVQPKK